MLYDVELVKSVLTLWMAFIFLFSSYNLISYIWLDRNRNEFPLFNRINISCGSILRRTISQSFLCASLTVATFFIHIKYATLEITSKLKWTPWKIWTNYQIPQIYFNRQIDFSFIFYIVVLILPHAPKI